MSHEDAADTDTTDPTEVSSHTSLPLYRGLEVDAMYQAQTIPSYQENPLIEALPDDFTDNLAVAKALSQSPLFAPEMRSWSVRERIHCIGDLEEQFFQPMSHHFSLEIKISRMLRRGYTMRNPIIPGFYSQLRQDVDSVSTFTEIAQQNRQLLRRPKAYGFNLIGPSGIGKSYTLESLLFLYPQVIRHTCYNDKRFIQRQLVWLKLDCPHDGSLKGLALAFFEAVDDILGTNYQRAYAGSRHASIDDLLRGMARVAALHFLGVLVVDEIQMLRAMRGDNSTKMLNFFVNLVNTIGVPVLLVGTDKARQLFEQRPAQARRGTGQGAETWYVMHQDEQWDVFLRSLFRYQYIQKPVALSKELNDVFFHHTQGITDLVIKLFVQCQIRSMTTEDNEARETITPALVRSVANDTFQMLKPVIDALRRRDKVALERLEDIYPFWREEHNRIHLAHMEAQSLAPASVDIEPRTTHAEEKIATPQKSSSTAITDKPPVRVSPVRKRQSQGVVYAPDSLISIVTKGKANHQSAYQALQQADCIFSLTSYTVEPE